IDAIRYALKANAANGRPRTGEDMRRAYDVAVANELCGPSDTNAVRALLGCSSRWARELTKGAREFAKVERDTRITALASEGKSQREIAAEVGVHHSTVQDVVGGKRNSSEIRRASLSAPEQQQPPVSRGVGVRYAHDA